MTDIVERLRRHLEMDCGPNGPDGRYAARLCMAAMAEAAAEIERLRAAQAWQPIETAPKHTLLLLWLPPVEWLDRLVSPARHAVGCWHRRAWRELEHGFTLKPTHWRPLPDAPV